ncbi:Bacteriophage lysis protein [Sodalis glossinidius str. 'morsitans']|uniref:Bacteriophage lysis protein n=1 Tax=Sodalis glossinidius (strain morsitans) TaxID=343509 RepID=A0A193QH77_SODGM|nr:lysis protein [Sodalis glossinidius]CRL44488.1 Bacteriophage lysis protein [Sodalis glossinidius str. 'morsitans']
MMRWKLLTLAALLLASMTGAALYYRALYQEAEQSRQRVETQAESRQAEIEQLNHQMQTIAALDLQHTRELENDKKRIAQLERDVADGRRRLQIGATCPNVSARAAARMDDATRARLTDTAQRNYFTLRRRIEIAEEQINGLQDYARQVCLSAGAKAD